MDVIPSYGEDDGTASTSGPALERVCLILCTRDRPAYLAEALATIRKVLPAAIEVIVVDSGSTSDETARVVADAGVRYVRSDVPGLSIARNAGLAATEREFAIYTDDDCHVQPGFAERLVAPFAADAVGATTGRLLDIADDRPAPEAAPNRVLSRTNEGLDAGHGALMAFRVSLLRSLGGFDPLLGAGRRFGGAEDLDAFCRILVSGSTLVQVPSAIVRHVFTRNDADYVTLNRAYGLGIGAMARKWVRSTGAPGRSLTALAVRRAAVRYARRWHNARTRAGQAAYLRGFADGYREAARIPLDGLRFQDVQPPAAVAAASATTPTGRPLS